MHRALTRLDCVYGDGGTYTSEQKCYDSTSCGPPAPPTNSRDFNAWLTPAKFQELVANMNGNIGTANIVNLLAAITTASLKFPTFCNTGNDVDDEREFCAFLAIIGAETSLMDTAGKGTACITETGCPCAACDSSTRCPCAYDNRNDCSNTPGNCACVADIKQQYYGRGPIQLSWNTNYGDFSDYYFGDRNKLLDNPDLVTDNLATCWASAVWFWMMPHDYGGWCPPQAEWSDHDACAKDPDSRPDCNLDTHYITPGNDSCHDAMHGGSGIGLVLTIVNGGYNSCKVSKHRNTWSGSVNRVWWYITAYMRWKGAMPPELTMDADGNVSGIQECSLLNQPQSDTCPDCAVLNCKGVTADKWWVQCQ
jgi:hypothetical protein